MSADDIVDSAMSYYIRGIHLCICKTINLLFVHTVATFFIYTTILLSCWTRVFVDLVYANYTDFYIIIIIDYYTQSYNHTVFSCSSWFCWSGQQPVVKGLTDSCAMILKIMLFFSIQVPVSKSLLSLIKLFFVVFCGCSTLMSIPIAAIYFSKPVDIAPNAPKTTGITITSFMPYILVIPFLTL